MSNLSQLFSPRILVVEGDATVSGLLAQRLAEEGFLVTTAATGWEALAQVDSNEFDVMITGLALPADLDALSLVRYARSRQPALKSLFMTEHGQPLCDDPDRDDFIAKPFEVRELLGCVWELFFRNPPQTPPISAYRAAQATMLKARIAHMKEQLANRCGKPAGLGCAPTSMPSVPHPPKSAA